MIFRSAIFLISLPREAIENPPEKSAIPPSITDIPLLKTSRRTVVILPLSVKTRNDVDAALETALP